MHRSLLLGMGLISFQSSQTLPDLSTVSLVLSLFSQRNKQYTRGNDTSISMLGFLSRVGLQFLLVTLIDERCVNPTAAV